MVDENSEVITNPKPDEGEDVVTGIVHDKPGAPTSASSTIHGAEKRYNAKKLGDILPSTGKKDI